VAAFSVLLLFGRGESGKTYRFLKQPFWVSLLVSLPSFPFGIIFTLLSGSYIADWTFQHVFPHCDLLTTEWVQEPTFLVTFFRLNTPVVKSKNPLHKPWLTVWDFEVSTALRIWIMVLWITVFCCITGGHRIVCSACFLHLQDKCSFIVFSLKFPKILKDIFTIWLSLCNLDWDLLWKFLPWREAQRILPKR
jgi:hypothetical protein